MDSSWKNLQIRMEAAWNMRTTPKTKRPKTGDIISSAHSLDWNTQQYILKNLNSLGNSVDFWGRKNDRQHVIDGMSAAQKSQLLCYILRNHEAFGKMTCRDWQNWLLDDAEPQFGIWF